MDTNQSPAKARKNQVRTTVAAIVDHILETYKPQDAPICLMWTEVMNGFYQKNGSQFSVLRRDSHQSHENWKTYGRKVASEFLRRHFFVAKVGADIRELVPHGTVPDRDTGKGRTDEAYRACLAGPHALTRGIVLFPPSQQENHPLILEQLERRGKYAVTSTSNAVLAVDTANRNKVLSDVEHERIQSNVKNGVMQALEDKTPLFHQKLGGIAPAESTRTMIVDIGHKSSED